MSVLGGTGTPGRVVWPWAVVAVVAIAAVALIAVLLQQQRDEPARTLLRPDSIRDWSRVSDDQTTALEEMSDAAMSSLRPGVDVMTATYVRESDGAEVKVGLMAAQDGDDLEDLVFELEDSTYGLVVARPPQATEAGDPGELGGSLTCGTVTLRRGARIACAWHDRTTAGALSTRLPEGAEPDVDLAEVTRDFREAMTQGS